MKTVTAFQQRIYDALEQVPRGQVTTYKALAAYVGCASCQAVGQALRRNPFAPDVPCHRVIGSDLRIGGFAGNRQGAAVTRKLKLLENEGVRFAEGRLADPSRLFDFTAAPQR